MYYYFILLLRAARLHFLRWSRYRTDVMIWIITIWITIGIQVCFVYVTFKSSGGVFFGYSPHELASFFGVSLVATGIAQSIVHGGLIVNLARMVWSGNFDFWLVQPAPLLLRMILDDMGFIWFWPHIVAGCALLLIYLPPTSWLLGIAAAVAAASLELAIMLLICLPTIRWGRWDPNEGLWEYMENARLMPVGRTDNIMLWLASFGVLQYSLALEVITGRLSILILLLISACVWTLALLLLKILVRSYTSASS